MATSTQTNIASLDAMISGFLAFAVANAGFTDEGADLGGTEPLRRVSKTVDGQLMYWGFREALVISAGSRQSMYQIEFRMMYELPTDANFDAGTNGQKYPSRMGAFDFPGPYTKYTFNTEGTGILCVLECSSGIFTHIAFGHITKCGTWTGGAYATSCSYRYYTHTTPDQWAPIQDGSHNSSQQLFGARANLSNNLQIGAGYIHYFIGGNDSTDFSKFGGDDNATASAKGVSGTISPSYSASAYASTDGNFSLGLYYNMMQYSPSSSTLRAPLFPVVIYRQSEDDVSNVNTLGVIPNVASVNIDNLAAGSVVNTDWTVYPLAQKYGDSVSATDSGYWGIAYKVVP